MKHSLRSVFRRPLCALLFLAATAGLAHADEYTRITTLLQKGEAAQAMREIDNALIKNPQDVQMHFLLGVAQTDIGRIDSAINTYVHLTSDYPELPEPYNNLAALYASRGELQKARAALEEAVRAKPDYAIAHENLGDIYVQLARRSYDLALKSDASLNSRVDPKRTLLHQALQRQPDTNAQAQGSEVHTQDATTAAPAPAPSSTTQTAPPPATKASSSRRDGSRIVPAGERFPWLSDGGA